MKRIRFGRTGEDVPVVSLGTWPHGGPNVAGDLQVGWTGHDDSLARDALREAHQQGITHWDTADVYGDGRAEQLIGSVWDTVPRDEIFLATKVGWDPGPYEHHYHPRQIRAQFARSLENLAVDYVDLYYLHHCNFGANGEHLAGAVEVFRELQGQGKIRFIGLSDWDCAEVVRYADRVDPDVVQVYRNVVDDAYESSGLKSWTERHDAGVAFFSPLRHGLLLGKYGSPPTFGAGDFRNRIAGFTDPDVLAKLRRCRDQLATRFGDHVEPVLFGLLAPLFTDSPNACALVGMRNPAQVRAAATVSDAMSPDDAAWVRALYRERVGSVTWAEE